MQPGSWDIQLSPQTPRSILTQLTELGTIHVTQAPIPPENQTSANVLAVARYSGIYLGGDSAFRLGGQGLLYYLGGDAHAGDPIVTDDLVFSGVSLSSALSTLLPAGSPILPGTIDTTGLSTITVTIRGASRRQALAQLCSMAGALFKIRPDGYVDASLNPFKTTPIVCVTKDASSWLGTPAGMEVAAVTVGKDATQYASDVVVIAQTGDGEAFPTATAAATDTYKDLFGNYVVFTKVVNAPTTPDASASAAAAGTLNLSTVRTKLAVAARSSDVRKWVTPGDLLYVYAPLEGVVGTSQVMFNGEAIAPATVQVQALSWPVTRQHGVYYRKSSGSIVDLTPYVVFEEDTDTWFDVGTGLAPSSDTTLPGVGLGDWQDALLRMNGSPTLPWTPAISASTPPTMGSGATLSGYYKIVDGLCWFQATIVFGSSGAAAGSGTYTITGLPVAAKSGRPTWLSGKARLTDSSGGVNCYPDLLVTDTSAGINLRYPAAWPTGADTLVSSSAPWTWANNDRIEFWGIYPLY